MEASRVALLLFCVAGIYTAYLTQGLMMSCSVQWFCVLLHVLKCYIMTKQV